MHGYTQKFDDKADLINKNMSIVKKIAYYYLGRLHQVVEIEDLLQIGMIGLIEAAHNYEPQEGVIFENYARLRELRAQLWITSASPPTFAVGLSRENKIMIGRSVNLRFN